ncbi:S-adenosyl-L-methionine-dependent tRNA 4-demethylwyosine synthase TYW1-like [Littorina saxatilis]|uniref:S-adenosyl-L-methionine-dependent tRNA 4-demethylwyosine synthase TYW1 n=1 Tax=Littorina saxatilis TaxID=31220 RepID=A0AAN9AI69_9CAEN
MLEKLLARWGGVHAWSVVVAVAGIAWVVYRSRRNQSDQSGKQAEDDIVDNQQCETVTVSTPASRQRRRQPRRKRKLKIFYGTQTGKSKMLAHQLAVGVQGQGYETEVINMEDYDPDDSLANEAEEGYVCVFIISTYTEGTTPEGAKWFCQWLEDTVGDFRVQKTLLSDLYFAVFGLGNSVYKEHFCTVARNMDTWLQQLSAAPLQVFSTGDENTADSKHGGIEGDFEAWRKSLWPKLKQALDGRKIKKCSGSTCSNKCGNCGPKGQQEKGQGEGQGHHHHDGKCSSDEEEEVQFESTSEEEHEETAASPEVTQRSKVVDLEDLGKIMHIAKVAKKKEEEELTNGEPREMVTPMLREALEKQGYRLIGSHSGVKLCRWTKSMLRGRGGCYKHTFYGIESHRCMETTPSLACANKCVFCWRHHTNPVGTEWRWKMDDPKTVLDGAIQNHLSLIKQFRGVPGVKPERLAEGMEPQHCALSLVGEPIMYPEINAFVSLLHDKGISSFLVTNAQFPEAIRNLVPVTQLYVSVDAATKDSLKKIDRPLFRDFWERFVDSLKALSDKGQRTVYRLTLVKAWNVEELDNYAQLVSLGQPDFIEIKGVTYCGESKASTLTMANVPWHEEVVGFVQQLADRLPDYELASEHEHSNCLLLAHKKFKIAGEWWTWIDYPQFHRLIKCYNESNGEKTFSAADYMAQTPHWAVYGAKEQGFDPDETRFYRKKQKDISGC